MTDRTTVRLLVKAPCLAVRHAFVPKAIALWSMLAFCGVLEAQVAQVVTVGDGDSVVVLMAGERVRLRLAEIDAPERGQPWSARAREALRDRVLDQRVRVDVIDVDRYGRSIAHIWLGSRHINRELVREGHAWVYTRYLVDDTLVADEAHARAHRLGLWSMPNPVEPWRWRRDNRTSRRGEANPG
jgi:micrococcal nuclease